MGIIRYMRESSKLCDPGHGLLSQHSASIHSLNQPIGIKLQGSPYQGMDDPEAGAVAQVALMREVA